jgi:hypothetical protein
MKVLSGLKDLVVDTLVKRDVAKQGMRFKYFDRWNPQLDEILKALPEEEICPHELFVELCANSGPVQKKIVLLEERGEPIGLGCFRYLGGYWVPVTHYIVPGFLFPVKKGLIGRALGAVGLNTYVAWWRWDSPPPSSVPLRDVRSEATHRVSCSEDFEGYWRETGQFKNVRKYRNRCKTFDFRVNMGGMRNWTIGNWDAKWHPQAAPETSDLGDRLLVSQFLERRGNYYTLSLHDGDKPVVGATVLVHLNDVVAQYNYRNPDYDWHGGMGRLIDLLFYWAKDMGFRKIDIGGSFDYKDKWAPEEGRKWEFTVCPRGILLGQQFLDLTQRVRNRLTVGSRTGEVARSANSEPESNSPPR